MHTWVNITEKVGAKTNTFLSKFARAQTTKLRTPSARYPRIQSCSEIDLLAMRRTCDCESILAHFG